MLQANIDELISEISNEFKMISVSTIDDNDKAIILSKVKCVLYRHINNTIVSENLQKLTWVRDGNIYKCPCCDFWFDEDFFEDLPNFCMECGADLRGDNITDNLTTSKKG